jgi:hypothetical protein
LCVFCPDSRTLGRWANGLGLRLIRFTLDGTRHELSRAVVEARLSDVLRELVRKHAVRVNDTWFPVIQAFETATGIPRSKFI